MDEESPDVWWVGNCCVRVHHTPTRLLLNKCKMLFPAKVPHKLAKMNQEAGKEV